MKIIVVDLDPGALSLLSKYLKILLPQAEINTFTDPFWSVKYAYNNQVDMIFTETKMRGLNGADVIRLVRRHENGFIPALYVTESEEEYEEEFCQTPANGFLKKPISIEQLQDLITKILKESTLWTVRRSLKELTG